ncbi:hypothetical protein M140_1077 [Bacteroides fragilis str. S38L3]|nr:hypothetical protein M140_1077 [Bacteroides fragilis str. S38L3]
MPDMHPTSSKEIVMMIEVWLVCTFNSNVKSQSYITIL